MTKPRKPRKGKRKDARHVSGTAATYARLDAYRKITGQAIASVVRAALAADIGVNDDQR